MKKKLIILIGSLFGLLSCQEQVVDLDYVMIESTTLTELSSQGIVIEATIGGDFNGGIIEQGFTWAQGKLSSNGFGSFNQNVPLTASKTFKLEIRDRMTQGIPYIIRAFAKTNTSTILGEPIEFKSLGTANGLVTTGISPTLVGSFDLVTITGKNFGSDASALEVQLQTCCTVYFVPVESVTDTSIKIKMPNASSGTVATVRVKKTNGDFAIVEEKIRWK